MHFLKENPLPLIFILFLLFSFFLLQLILFEGTSSCKRPPSRGLLIVWLQESPHVAHSSSVITFHGSIKVPDLNLCAERIRSRFFHLVSFSWIMHTLSLLWASAFSDYLPACHVTFFELYRNLTNSALTHYLPLMRAHIKEKTRELKLPYLLSHALLVEFCFFFSGLVDFLNQTTCGVVRPHLALVSRSCSSAELGKFSSFFCIFSDSLEI